MFKQILNIIRFHFSTIEEVFIKYFVFYKELVKSKEWFSRLISPVVKLGITQKKGQAYES